ncbi:MAG: cytochrome o ubiquinol oxidase subunit IV [Epibacterium sp.]|jgi:cytochrome o ubiquinol oxidase operon protein cyoD|nr:cytochrome o ubiquinol oxidase subunit IV [Epibacterium sp.]NQX75103.1 cytochrome o ubiquinol oxidase subunit IV [Epibacterium sp.]
MSSHDHSDHGSYRSYIIGFLLSVVLTVVPFWIVMADVDVSLGVALAVIFGLGAIQVLVHVYYFLHVTVQAEDGWQFMSLLFTAILLIIIMSGSIWVMLHLHENMMPAHEQIDRVRNVK